jgi:tripartite-type tricarboxylate transporter receptor subunit TctC
MTRIADSRGQARSTLKSSMRRMTLLAAAAAGVLNFASLPLAMANGYPDRAIRLVVPFPPGGPTDVAARIVGQKLSEKLGQSVVVENRPGASGVIAAKAVARSEPDGYTVMVLANPTMLAPHLYGAQDFDIFKDFAPVAGVYDVPIVMIINPKALPGVTSLEQLVAYAKANPGVNYTSAGNGSFGHLSLELMKSMGKFDMQHVPYKGSAPAMTDVLGGQIPVMFSDMIAALPHIQAGKLLPIAVGSAERVVFTPEVKTVAEQGFPGFEAVSWGGWVVPANTPSDVINVLSNNLKDVLADADIQEKLKQVGTTARYLPADAMAQRVRVEYDKWGKVIHDNHISNN